MMRKMGYIAGDAQEGFVAKMDSPSDAMSTLFTRIFTYRAIFEMLENSSKVSFLCTLKFWIASTHCTLTFC